jgi:hypothetical protein
LRRGDTEDLGIGRRVEGIRVPVVSCGGDDEDALVGRIGDRVGDG